MKMTHAILFFILANLLIWSAVWGIDYFKFSSSPGPATLKSTATLNVDKSVARAPLLKEDTPSTYYGRHANDSWFSKSWPILASILTTLPTIALKWKDMFDILFKQRKSTHRKRR